MHISCPHSSELPCKISRKILGAVFEKFHKPTTNQLREWFYGTFAQAQVQKPDQNRTFFMDFGAFFWWNLTKFEDISFALDHLMYDCKGSPHAYFLIDVQKSNFSNFEKVPKSIKNVRFGSGFLHVILKLIPQQDPIGKHSYLTFIVQSFELCRPLFEATNPAVS